MHRENINYMQRLKYVQNKIKREATNKNRKNQTISHVYIHFILYNIYRKLL